MSYLITSIFLSVAIWLNHAALALILGIALVYLFSLPEDFFTRKYGTKILQTGIVFLGGSISISQVTIITKDFLPWISIFVIATFLLVIILGKIIGVTKKQSYLLASGTAICGGTAMASVAPVIKAKPEELLPALSIVFILNGIAVIIFPMIGVIIGLNEDQFGAWVALAVHDTASVIGAASVLGDRAVEIAATLKIGRTLWIVPLVLFSAFYFREDRKGLGFPIFIIFFLIAVILNSLLNPSSEINTILKNINKICLLTGLFCIGTQIDKKAIKEITLKPLTLAVIVWGVVIPTSLWVIY